MNALFVDLQKDETGIDLEIDLVTDLAIEGQGPLIEETGTEDLIETIAIGLTEIAAGLIETDPGQETDMTIETGVIEKKKGADTLGPRDEITETTGEENAETLMKEKTLTSRVKITERQFRRIARLRKLPQSTLCHRRSIGRPRTVKPLTDTRNL